jgi:hypothetical protein
MLGSPGIGCRSARRRLLWPEPCEENAVVQAVDVDKIRTGWTAFDMPGVKIGDVAEIGSNYLLVVKGLFLPTDPYIPLSRVMSVNEAQATFEVKVPKEKVEAIGWTNPPADGSWDASGAADSLAVTLRSEHSDAARGYVDADETRR